MYHKITNWWWKLKMFLQEKFRGYPDYAKWNLNDYIVDKIRPPLKKFLEYDNSYPMDITSKEWRVILKKIEFSFDNYGEDGPWMEWVLKHREEMKEGESMQEYFNKKEPPTPKMIVNAEKKYNDKVQEGFELFGKHLQHLWD